MALEIKKLDEKRYELVESVKVVRTKEELKILKKNILENIKNIELQKKQLDLNSVELLKKLQKINLTLGLNVTDGLTKEK